MSAAAVLMMLVAMVVVWGGLVASVVFLRAKPEVDFWPGEGPTDEEDQSFD